MQDFDSTERRRPASEGVLENRSGAASTERKALTITIGGSCVMVVAALTAHFAGAPVELVAVAGGVAIVVVGIFTRSFQSLFPVFYPQKQAYFERTGAAKRLPSRPEFCLTARVVVCVRGCANPTWVRSRRCAAVCLHMCGGISQLSPCFWGPSRWEPRERWSDGRARTLIGRAPERVRCRKVCLRTTPRRSAVLLLGICVVSRNLGETSTADSCTTGRRSSASLSLWIHTPQLGSCPRREDKRKRSGGGTTSCRDTSSCGGQVDSQIFCMRNVS
jgi:hypothetical protein